MPDSSPVGAALDDSTIEIVVPLRSEHAATLRVIVASLGSDHDLSVDEIDDLKLAVSEVFNVLIDSLAVDTHGRARVRYTTHPDHITVELDRDGDGNDLEIDTMATMILSSVVDEHRVTASGVTLVKRGREARD